MQKQQLSLGQDTKGKEHGEVSAAVRDEEKFGNAETPGALKKIHALVPRCLFCGSLAPTSPGQDLLVRSVQGPARDTQFCAEKI